MVRRKKRTRKAKAEGTSVPGPVEIDAAGELHRVNRVPLEVLTKSETPDLMDSLAGLIMELGKKRLIELLSS